MEPMARQRQLLKQASRSRLRGHCLMISRPMIRYMMSIVSLIGCAPPAAPVAPVEEAEINPIVPSDVSGEIAFVNATVLTMMSEEIHHNFSVLVRNQRIAAIGETGSFDIPVTAQVIECQGAFLMPGLADMHTHVYYREDLLPYVANGVTTVLNMGSPSTILQFRDLVSAGELLGPTILGSGFVDGIPPNGWVVTTAEEARATVRNLKQAKWDFIKVYNSIKTDVFLALMDEARKEGMPVIGHGVREPGMERILNEGQVMVAHAEEYIYTFFHNSLNEAFISEAVALTVSTRAYVTPTLSAYEIIKLQWGNQQGLETLLA